MYKLAICDDSQDMTTLVHELTQKWATARDLTTEINVFDSAEAFIQRTETMIFFFWT